MMPVPHVDRQRGGTFFTMTIFIMMLASTMLMYYYFQRSRALENDLRAIQRGEMAPGDADNGFFGRWSGSDDRSPAPPPASVQTPAIAGTGENMAPGTTNASPAAGYESGTVDSGTAAPSGAQQAGQAGSGTPVTESDNRLQLDALEPEGDVGRQPDDAAVQVDTASSVDQAEPGDGASEEDASGENPQQDFAEETSEPSGESLYDMEPPPIRVRAPRRD